MLPPHRGGSFLCEIYLRSAGHCITMKENAPARAGGEESV